MSFYIMRMMKKLSSSTLHIIAMGLMLSDHLWATLFPSYDILTCLGRLAFPIFAFLTVEGYFHTSDFRKYLLRMFLFACISEIPFDLMYGGQIIYPYHQNVLWTFLISLILIHWIDQIKKKNRLWLTVLGSFFLCLLGFILGYLCMTDYYGAGIITVLGFYFFRGKGWRNYLGQLMVLYFVNVELLGGYYYPISIGPFYFELQQQSLALLSLIFIWSYSGEKGISAKSFKYFCYLFYPVHMLAIYLLWQTLIG